jgi:hypothetical protein
MQKNTQPHEQQEKHHVRLPYRMYAFHDMRRYMGSCRQIPQNETIHDRRDRQDLIDGHTPLSPVIGPEDLR